MKQDNTYLFINWDIKTDGKGRPYFHWFYESPKGVFLRDLTPKDKIEVNKLYTEMFIKAFKEFKT